MFRAYVLVSPKVHCFDYRYIKLSTPNYRQIHNSTMPYKHYELLFRLSEVEEVVRVAQ